MQLVSTVKEFCDSNKDNWQYQYDYDKDGLFINIANLGFKIVKSIVIHEKHIHAIHIESNQLCIALKSKIMIWLGGDTGTFEIDSTDYNNPMFKDLKE